MSDLHELLVTEAQRMQPTVQPAFEELTARAQHRRRMRVTVTGAAAVAVVVATIIGTVALRGGNNQMSLSPTRPLITQGECAGLSVTATLPGHPGSWPVQQGTQPEPVTMPPDAMMWLRAHGPCVQRLRISASTGLIQTATGGVTAFNKQGIGLIVSHGKAGDATIDLFLSRTGPASKLATIPVAITRNGTATTASPSASPSPMPWVAVDTDYAHNETFCARKPLTGKIKYVVKSGRVTLRFDVHGLPRRSLIAVNWINSPARGYVIAFVRSTAAGTASQSTLRIFRGGEVIGQGLELQNSNFGPIGELARC